MPNLFVIDLEYIASQEAIQAEMAAHREYLEVYYDNGTFLASGPKEPRTGGVILAVGDSNEIQIAVEADPFFTASVARFTITEFMPNQTGAVLEAFRQSA